VTTSDARLFFFSFLFRFRLSSLMQGWCGCQVLGFGYVELRKKITGAFNIVPRPLLLYNHNCTVNTQNTQVSYSHTQKTRCQTKRTSSPNIGFTYNCLVTARSVIPVYELSLLVHDEKICILIQEVILT